MAALCLSNLNEHDECLSLLDPFIIIEEGLGEAVANRIRALIPNTSTSVNIMAGCFSYYISTFLNLIIFSTLFVGLYFLAGRCFDTLDNRPRALRALTTGLRIDPACTGIADYICSRGLLSQIEKRNLLGNVIRLTQAEEEGSASRRALRAYYRCTSPLSCHLYFAI